MNEQGSSLPYHVQMVLGEPGEQVPLLSALSTSQFLFHVMHACIPPSQRLTWQLCRLAESLNVRMVVVGSHGKGALRRALLGSVSPLALLSLLSPLSLFSTFSLLSHLSLHLSLLSLLPMSFISLSLSLSLPCPLCLSASQCFSHVCNTGH